MVAIACLMPGAEGQMSTQGRDFWVMFTINYDGTGNVSLFAAGDTSCSINVSIPLMGWSQNYSLTGGSYVNIQLPQTYANPGTNTGVLNKGIHVTSTHNISLYAANLMEYSFDITTVLPTYSLRRHYITQDYPCGSTNGILMGSLLGMVATSDSTTVDISLSTATLNGYTQGSMQHITLNAGQSYIAQAVSGGTFSGTEVSSSAPLAVFQGNRATTVPCGYPAADHLYEQALPTDYWGRDFVLVPLALRSGQGDQVRVTSAENGCMLYLDGVYLTTLAAKSTHEFTLSYGAARRLTTTKPATVCLYISGGSYGGQPGDPSSVVIPPVEQGVYSVVFNAYATSQTTYHYTNVVCRTEHVPYMTLDGTNISSQFVVLDTAISYAKIPVNSGTHTLSNTSGTFSAFFYGLGTWESYAYIAGMGLRNLMSALFADSVDVQTLSNGITICANQTVHFVIETNSNATTAQWLVDGVLQTGNTLQHNHTFTTSGDHEVQAIFHGQYNPALVDTLSVTVHVQPLNAADINVTVCDTNYRFEGSTYYVSGDYSSIKPSTDPSLCDSLLRLHLTVGHSSTGSMSDTVVENQLPVLWNGHSFTGDTVYPLQTLTNAVGCDSLVSYSLKVYWNVHTESDTTVCDNMLPATWHSQTFVAEGTLTDTMTTAHGADSVVSMTLHISPTWRDTVDVNICDSLWSVAGRHWQANSLTFEGSAYSQAGLFPTMLHTVTYGCDSIRVLQLSLRQSSTGDTAADECDHFDWYGQTLTASCDTATLLTTNAAGCDSLVTLALTLRHSTSSDVSDSVVENDLPHTFNNVVFSDSTGGTIITIANTAGCDSTIAYSLFVHRNVDTTLYDTVCNDALPVVWLGKTFGLTAAGDTLDLLNQGNTTLIDSLMLYDRHGADSTVWLRLTVHPLYNHLLTTSICDNGSIAFGDSIFSPDASTTHNIGTAQLRHTDSLTSVHGCDSLSSLHLTVNPTFGHHLHDTVCTNQSYTWGTPMRNIFAPEHIARTLHGSDSLASFVLGDGTLPADTTTTDSLTSVVGCDSLSSLHLHIQAAYDLHFHDTICDAHIGSFQDDSSALWISHAYPFSGLSADSTGSYVLSLATHEGCDSLRTLHLKIYPTYDQHRYDTIYAGDLLTFEGNEYDTTGTWPLRMTAAYGCDSLRTLHLQRWPRVYIDTVVCQNNLPYIWNNVAFADGQGLHTQGGMQIIKDSVHLALSGGGDSMVVMMVVVRDTVSTTDVVHACDSAIWHHTPDTVYRAGTNEPHIVLTQQTAFDTTGLASQQRGGRYQAFTVHLASFAAQCDSVHHLLLTVDSTHYSTDFRIACDSTDWPQNSASLTAQHRFYSDTTGRAGTLGSFTHEGPVDTLVTAGGCDSVVALSLAIRHATYECAVDTFCWNEIYTWRSQQAGDTTERHAYTTDRFHLEELLQTHRFVHPQAPAIGITCDSVMAINLTQMARPHLTLTDSIDCDMGLYQLTLATDMPYMRWTDRSTGYSTEWRESIVAAPDVTTTYHAVVDYRQTTLCPLGDSLTLRTIVIPEAQIKVNPEALNYNSLDFNAYDISTVSPRSIHPGDPDTWRRAWYVNHVRQAEESVHLHHTATPDRDTVLLSLCVYNGQCPDTASHPIPLLRTSLFAPNIITPMLDGNNRFFIVGQGITRGTLYIYDREGRLVRMLPDYNDGWDGRDMQGRICPQGAYVWKLEYRDTERPDSNKKETGTVLLIQ